MGGDDAGDPLRDLGRRLDEARQKQARSPKEGESATDDGDARKALALGLRIGLELVVAVCFGAALGWAFDKWLGTQPWGLIGFLFLGFAAGVTNVFRVATAAERAVGYRRTEEKPGDRAKWTDDED